ncbi:uncharacterized protein SAPINGB_P005847 [Magnusiomyces paraingens]|uniref:Genetic interactor of prohibitins 3, mitochondrial n=1 Tax=Magnusiomyces paraingens TaxID=2606893 RepID=A0A5E8C306_9ASCO|nr:uncharacterized protein SAPINGB_P005847 [Saprochaete ingens]VVT57742.1 unnamed protein product [Saprochaete ingens]
MKSAFRLLSKRPLIQPSRQSLNILRSTIVLSSTRVSLFHSSIPNAQKASNPKARKATKQIKSNSKIFVHKVTDLVPKCNGCGTPFQRTFPESLGYYDEPDSKLRTKSIQDKKLEHHNNLFGQMDTLSQAIYSHSVVTGEVAEAKGSEEVESSDSKKKEERHIIEADSSPALKIEDFVSDLYEKRLIQSIKDTQRDEINSGLCTTCRLTKGGQYFDYTKVGHPSTEEVLAQIPKDGVIIHVISGQEFPASFIPEITKYAADRKIIYVVTKCDLAVDEQFKTRQRFLPYVQRELYDKYKVNPDDVYAVSTLVKWGVEELFQDLPVDSYIVGLPNTGKTALAFSLGNLYKTKLLKDSLPIEQRQRKYGISHLPLKTKAPISYINSGRRITDLPAVQAERGIVYNYINPKKLLTTVNSSVFIKRLGLPSATPVTITKNGSALSLGGIVFVQMDDAPPNVTLICWCVCGNRKQVVQRFSSVEKAVEISAAPLNSQQDWFLTKPYDINDPEQAAKFKPQKVMSVRIDGAGFDFGVLGYASVILTLSGKIPENGVGVTLYALPGVEICPRTPIIKHMKAFQVSKRQEKMQKIKRGSVIKDQNEHRDTVEKSKKLKAKALKNEERKKKKEEKDDDKDGDDFDFENYDVQVKEVKNPASTTSL